MAALDPLPISGLNPELRGLIDKAVERRALSNTVLARLWSHRPELAAAQVALHTRFYDSNLLDGRLLELVRLRIAALNDCLPCKAARKSDQVAEAEVSCLSSQDERFTPRERAALAFAEGFALDHQGLGKDAIAGLLQQFSTPEIVELGMFVALMLGSGRLAHVLTASE
jgi:alkylhydroperoxidase family enzyme